MAGKSKTDSRIVKIMALAEGEYFDTFGIRADSMRTDLWRRSQKLPADQRPKFCIRTPNLDRPLELRVWRLPLKQDTETTTGAELPRNTDEGRTDK